MLILDHQDGLLVYDFDAGLEEVFQMEKLGDIRKIHCHGSTVIVEYLLRQESYFAELFIGKDKIVLNKFYSRYR